MTNKWTAYLIRSFEGKKVTIRKLQGFQRNARTKKKLLNFANKSHIYGKIVFVCFCQRILVDLLMMMHVKNRRIFEVISTAKKQKSKR